MSNNEFFLTSLLNGETVEDFIPQSRTEEYLKACCNGTGTNGLPTPISRNDALLYGLVEKLADDNIVCACTVAVTPLGVADDCNVYSSDWSRTVAIGFSFNLEKGSYVVEIHADGYGNESGYSSKSITITDEDISNGTKTIQFNL